MDIIFRLQKLSKLLWSFLFQVNFWKRKNFPVIFILDTGEYLSILWKKYLTLVKISSKFLPKWETKWTLSTRPHRQGVEKVLVQNHNCRLLSHFYFPWEFIYSASCRQADVLAIQSHYCVRFFYLKMVWLHACSDLMYIAGIFPCNTFISNHGLLNKHGLVICTKSFLWYQKHADKFFYVDNFLRM